MSVKDLVTVASLNERLQFIRVGESASSDDCADALARLVQSPEEVVLVRGICRYEAIGSVRSDGIFALTNKRWILLSFRSKASLATELFAWRILMIGVVTALLWIPLVVIPRALYWFLRGGKKAYLERALALDDGVLLGPGCPFRPVDAFDHEMLAQCVESASIKQEFLESAYTIAFARRSIIGRGASASSSAPTNVTTLHSDDFGAIRDLARVFEALAENRGLRLVTHRKDMSLTIERADMATACTATAASQAARPVDSAVPTGRALALFCSGCGAPFEAAARFCPACGAPRPSTEAKRVTH